MHGHDAPCLSSCFDVTRHMAQDGAGELRDEAFDQVLAASRAWAKVKSRAACGRPGVEPGSGFPRNVCGTVVDDQPIAVLAG